MKHPHLITILGPTASGKTSLAIQLAQEVDGEIICADSRTIYRGMDIGTAKPSKQERAQIPHHLLDLVDPGEHLSVAAFKTLAEAQIHEIAARGKVPFLVGGSGLYIDAVLFDYQFPAPADPERRAQLEMMNDESLLEMLAAEDPVAYERTDLHNRRRVIRAIETAGQVRSKNQRVRERTLVLGTAMNKEIAQKRISQRVEKMLNEGLFDEVQNLVCSYGWEAEAMSGIGYREFKEVLSGDKPLEDARAMIVQNTMAFYKRQLTWFKRNPSIHWIENAESARKLVREFLR